MADRYYRPSCPAPLISQGNFPPHEGDITGRICMTSQHGLSNLSCCLPCHSTEWLYSDPWPHKALTANYVSIATFVLHTFLLLTFIVIPREKSHRHYLSIGLTVSFMLISLAFVIPLGTKPDFCHNEITPNDLHTDASCAATGVLLELGAMGAVVWIFLRSIWTVLRITTDFKRAELFKKIAIGLGIGLPILFMAISLPITGVAYSLGNVCVPSNATALPTWFAWILIFNAISWIIQVFTILFCLWKFAIFSLTRGRGTGTGTSQSSIPYVTPTSPAAGGEIPQTPQKPMTASRQRRHAWRKINNILALQWRSIVMAFIVVNLTIFFGMVFINHVAANQARIHAPMVDMAWFQCLIATEGDKHKCPEIGLGNGLSEARATGTLILASFIGIIVFLLMVRSSMFVGWWHLIRNPRNPFRRPSLDQEAENSRRKSSMVEKTDGEDGDVVKEERVELGA